jgi:peptidoglycan/xylan/chitin deacetylase (PgdA/CDA1 family)
MVGLYARQLHSKMIVVAFHRVTDELPGDPITCSSAKFEKFCEFFLEHFRVISLSEQISANRARADTGGTLSITFDDGYQDNFEVAAPILRRLRLPATFFVTTGFIGTDMVPSWDRHLAPPPRWMDWDQVRSLASQGFEIGSHTHSHLDLGTADVPTVREELQASQHKLLQELGHTARLFAYPFGGRENISVRSRELVREAGFICCAACFGGVNAPTADPFDLKRIGIAEWFRSPQQFGFELLTGKA